MNKRKFIGLKPYKSGEYASNIEDKYPGNLLRLALSENPYGMCKESRQVAQDEVSTLNYYPDSDSITLRHDIAKLYNVHEDMVIISNGVDELILLIALAFLNQGDTAITSENTFLGYCAAVQIAGGTMIKIPLTNYRLDVDAFLCYKNHKPSLVYLCNPHNPTGTILKENEVNKLISSFSTEKSIIVFDEAYAEYANSQTYVSALNYLEKYSNIIVLRTFSKIYGMAGLRCGYAIARPELINQLCYIRNVLPFNTNRLAQKVASVAVRNQDYIMKIKEQNNKVKEYFYSELEKLGIEFIKSETNFVLIKIPIEGKSFYDLMIKKYGIVLRDAEQLGFKNHLRVTLGTLKDMKYLIKCFSETLFSIT